MSDDITSFSAEVAEADRVIEHLTEMIGNLSFMRHIITAHKQSISSISDRYDVVYKFATTKLETQEKYGIMLLGSSARIEVSTHDLTSIINKDMENARGALMQGIGKIREAAIIIDGLRKDIEEKKQKLKETLRQE